jgi:hypothetical protein
LADGSRVPIAMALASAAIFAHLCIKLGLRICADYRGNRRVGCTHPHHVIAPGKSPAAP